jgi:hypothetical protein
MNFSDSVCRISASGDALKKYSSISASFYRDFGIVCVQSQCLYIGANDVTNSADFGVPVDFVDAGFLLAKTTL